LVIIDVPLLADADHSFVVLLPLRLFNLGTAREVNRVSALFSGWPASS
jgi:hypothetical protein